MKSNSTSKRLFLEVFKEMENPLTLGLEKLRSLGEKLKARNDGFVHKNHRGFKC